MRKIIQKLNHIFWMKFDEVDWELYKFAYNVLRVIKFLLLEQFYSLNRVYLMVPLYLYLAALFITFYDLIFGVDQDNQDGMINLTMMMMVFGGAIYIYYSFRILNRMRWILKLSALITSIIIVIALGALLHQMLGLVQSGAPLNTSHVPSISDAFYFSAVTFTTLGLGDFQPTVRGRIPTAVQAAVGYLYLGLSIALVDELIRSKTPKNNRNGHRQNNNTNNDRSI